MNLPFAETLLATYVGRRARRQPVAPLAAFEAGEVRRILLILTTGIGDAILSSAIFPSIRAAFPAARIALFCRTGWCPLFRADPHLDEVIPYPGKFRQFFATLKTLRQFQPDLSLVLHGNDPDIIPLAYLAGSRFILRIPTRGTRFGDLLANAQRPEDQQTQPQLHYIDNRLRLLDTLGIPAVTRAPSIHLPQALLDRTQTRLRACIGERPYWVLHLHGADPYKSLPDSLGRELIALALERFPAHGLVLSGGPENRSVLKSLLPGNAKGRVCVAAGSFSLEESAACLAGAQAVVAPDTGILHLAAALDRPVIGLYAPTRANLVGPRAPGRTPLIIAKPLTCTPCLQKRCPYRPVTCMSQFSSAEILQALTPLLIP